MKEKTKHNLKEVGGALAAYGLLFLVVIVAVLILSLFGGLPPGVPGK